MPLVLAPTVTRPAQPLGGVDKCGRGKGDGPSPRPQRQVDQAVNVDLQLTRRVRAARHQPFNLAGQIVAGPRRLLLSHPSPGQLGQPFRARRRRQPAVSHSPADRRRTLHRRLAAPHTGIVTQQADGFAGQLALRGRRPVSGQEPPVSGHDNIERPRWASPKLYR